MLFFVIFLTRFQRLVTSNGKNDISTLLLEKGSPIYDVLEKVQIF